MKIQFPWQRGESPLSGGVGHDDSSPDQTGNAPGNDKYAFANLAAAVGKLLATPEGPRIAALEIGGWDTHNAQLARLPPILTQLDRGIVALKENTGPSWRRTARRSGP